MTPGKAGPALAADCTMVLKPATATPFSALALCELSSALACQRVFSAFGPVAPLYRFRTDDEAVKMPTTPAP